MQSPLHQDAIALSRCLAGVLRLLDLSDQELERFADVLVISCARLGPAALDLLGHLLSIFGGNLSLLGSQVALVADDDDGDGFGTLIKHCWLVICTCLSGCSAGFTRWLRIFSRMTCTISKEGRDDTEYTSM